MRPEDALQIHMVQWLRLALPPHWIVQHTANKPRSRQSGALEKRMGATAGWPDITVLGPETIRFLEVKTPTGVVSPDQKRLHCRLEALGYSVAVVRSLRDLAEWALAEGLPISSAALLRSGCAGEAGAFVPAKPLTSSPKADEVQRLWRGGLMDTRDIAKATGLPEHRVYAIIHVDMDRRYEARVSGRVA